MFLGLGFKLLVAGVYLFWLFSCFWFGCLVLTGLVGCLFGTGLLDCWWLLFRWLLHSCGFVVWWLLAFGFCGLYGRVYVVNSVGISCFFWYLVLLLVWRLLDCLGRFRVLVLVLYVGLGCLVGVRLRDVMTWLVLDFDVVCWLLV